MRARSSIHAKDARACSALDVYQSGEACQTVRIQADESRQSIYLLDSRVPPIRAVPFCRTDAKAGPRCELSS